MTENQEELDMEVGTKEMVKLQPAKVKIGEINIEEVKFGKKVSKKVICSCIHPNKEATVAISAVKFQKGDKLVTSGLWISKDEDEKLMKESSLALLMKHLAAVKLSDLNGKECDTTLDDKGYLVFKMY